MALGAVAISGFLLPVGVVVVLAMAVVVAFGVDAWMVREVPEVSRTVADVLSRGVAAPLEVSVTLPPQRVRVRQPGTPDLRIEPTVSDGGLVGTVTALRRGHHDLPPVAVRVRGVLGLAQWSRSVGQEHGVEVYPDMPAAYRIAARVRRGVFQLEGARLRGALGLGTAFESIREYVDGDDVRRVNWLATARSDHPMVNQYRIEQDRDVICVLDAGRLMGAPVGDRTRMDAAVDASAVIDVSKIGFQTVVDQLGPGIDQGA